MEKNTQWRFVPRETNRSIVHQLEEWEIQPEHVCCNFSPTTCVCSTRQRPMQISKVAETSAQKAGELPHQFPDRLRQRPVAFAVLRAKRGSQSFAILNGSLHLVPCLAQPAAVPVALHLLALSPHLLVLGVRADHASPAENLGGMNDKGI